MRSCRRLGSEIFEFSNGIRVYRRDLIPEQRRRYAELGSPVLHEPVEEQWLRISLDRLRSKRIPVFVDVGCALGYYSILVKKLLPSARVISIDPNPQFHRRYLETMKLNGLAEADLELMQKAVYPNSRIIDLVVKGFSSHVRRFPSSPDTDEQIVPVEAVTMDQLLEIVGTRIDLMKIDIQGSELDLFKALDIKRASASIPALIVGTHGKVIHEELTELLSGSYKIAFEQERPPHQPDGIIVAYKDAL